jgi:hypothetical protein
MKDLELVHVCRSGIRCVQYVVQLAQDALARVYSQKEGRANELAHSPVQFQRISFCAITLHGEILYGSQT